MASDARSASVRALRAAPLAALVCLSILGCLPEEGTPVRIALEVVGPPPAPGSTCSGPEVWWLAKSVDGSDVNIGATAHGDMSSEADAGGAECVWRIGPATILTLGRYRFLATDGEWLAVCDEIASLFLQEGNLPFHRIQFRLGEPDCTVTTGQSL